MTDTSIAPTPSPDSFRAVIDLWQDKACDACGTRVGAREAMSADTGAPASAITKWWQRDNIPAEWWQSIVDSNTGKAGRVTNDLLADLASRKIAKREPAEARP